MNATRKKSETMSLMFCFILVFAGIASVQESAPAGNGKGISPAQALARYEQALQAATDPARRFYLMTETAHTALAAGETEKAKNYARGFLEQAAAMQTNWNYGNASHVGNLVLGQIALDSGDVTEAKRLLLEAGKSPDSLEQTVTDRTCCWQSNFLQRVSWKRSFNTLISAPISGRDQRAG